MDKNVDTFLVLGYAINAIGFIYGVVTLKSTQILREIGKIIPYEQHGISNWKNEKKWVTAKLPIIAWLALLFGMSVPYVGGVASYLVGAFYTNEYLPTVYTTRQTPFYVKLKTITKRVLTILCKPFKWLLIEL